MALGSWKTIARELSSRIFPDGCSEHRTLDPDNCPFCADIRAETMYKEKVEGKSDISWSDLSDILANCINFSFCESHSKIVKDCPYCDDVKAYKNYVRKVESEGYVIVDPFADAVMVSIFDLKNENEVMSKNEGV